MSKLKNRFSAMNSKGSYEISDDLNDLINNYIHTKLISDVFNSSDFINKTESQIEEMGIYAEVERLTNELGNILAEASKVAYTNYEEY